MSYQTISQCVTDPAFYARVNACVAQEQLTKNEVPQPNDLTQQMLWAVAAADDVEAAYASAVAKQHKNPGGDDSVVTDAMILSHVQSNWPAAPAP